MRLGCKSKRREDKIRKQEQEERGRDLDTRAEERGWIRKQKHRREGEIRMQEQRRERMSLGCKSKMREGVMWKKEQEKRG